MSKIANYKAYLVKQKKDHQSVRLEKNYLQDCESFLNIFTFQNIEKNEEKLLVHPKAELRDYQC